MAAPNKFKNNTPCRNVTTKGLSMKRTRIEINSSRCRRSRIAVITCLENAQEVYENDVCRLHVGANNGRDWKGVSGHRAEQLRPLLRLPFPRGANRRRRQSIVDLCPRRSCETTLSCDQARAGKRRSRKCPTDKNSASGSGRASSIRPQCFVRSRGGPWATRINPS